MEKPKPFVLAYPNETVVSYLGIRTGVIKNSNYDPDMESHIYEIREHNGNLFYAYHHQIRVEKLANSIEFQMTIIAIIILALFVAALIIVFA